MRLAGRPRTRGQAALAPTPSSCARQDTWPWTFSTPVIRCRRFALAAHAHGDPAAALAAVDAFPARFARVAGCSASELKEADCSAQELLQACHPETALSGVYERPDLGLRVPSCPAGHYHNLARRLCWPCVGGTFAAGAGVRAGRDDHVSGCPGRCSDVVRRADGTNQNGPGYTSDAEATSPDDCCPCYGLIDPGDDTHVGWCSGAVVGGGSDCPFNDHAYHYVTTRGECNLGARLIAGSNQAENSVQLASAATRVEDADEKTVCKEGAVGGGARCNEAPLGYCGVELPARAAGPDTNGTQRLVLYTGDAGRQPPPPTSCSRSPLPPRPRRPRLPSPASASRRKRTWIPARRVPAPDFILLIDHEPRHGRTRRACVPYVCPQVIAVLTKAF